MGDVMKNIRNGQPLAAHDDAPKQKDDFWHRLASEIVVAAVRDWRSLIRLKKWNDWDPREMRNFDELRNFLKSEWCEFLMKDFEMDPAALLELLEKELQEAMQKEVKK